MAFGLPVEGEAGPFIVDFLSDPVTCRPDEVPRQVAERLAQADRSDRAVVVDDQEIVLGVVDVDSLHGADRETSILDLMDVGPSTVRPSVEASSFLDSEKGTSADAPLVTSSDGRLLGVVDADALAENSGPDTDDLEKQVLELTGALEEEFGDREPSGDELRSFLRGRLMDEGRTAEEADRFLDDMEQEGAG